MADACRCHLPLDPPFDRHWLPWRDPEPDSSVRAVALYGQEPSFLRRVRIPEGWHTAGSGANHPDCTPAKPWEDVGRCWADVQHPVVDATAFVATPVAGRVWPLAELRSAAMALAGHGWPVLRGTYTAGARWKGRPDAVGLRPVDDDWSVGWTLDRAELARWWTSEPFSVLVACGHGVDSLELPGSVGHRLLGPLREAGIRAPAMVSPAGTLLLFVRTHTGPRPFLTSVTLRSCGSWVAVPPTGGYRWLPNASPAAVDWTLPALQMAYEAIVAVIRR